MFPQRLARTQFSLGDGDEDDFNIQQSFWSLFCELEDTVIRWKMMEPVQKEVMSYELDSIDVVILP